MSEKRPESNEPFNPDAFFVYAQAAAARRHKGNFQNRDTARQPRMDSGVTRLSAVLRRLDVPAN